MIRGNVLATSNECRRLEALAEAHETAGQLLRRLRTEGWSGRAADRFTEVRDDRARAWLAAGDCHAEVRAALTEYVDVLAELQPRARSLMADATRSGDPAHLLLARQTIDRWQQQIADAGHRAAVRAATAELASLTRVEWAPIPQRVSVPPLVPRPARKPPDTPPPPAVPARRPSPRSVAPDPFDAHTAYDQRLATLCVAIARFWRS